MQSNKENIQTKSVEENKRKHINQAENYARSLSKFIDDREAFVKHLKRLSIENLNDLFNAAGITERKIAQINVLSWFDTDKGQKAIDRLMNYAGGLMDELKPKP